MQREWEGGVIKWDNRYRRRNNFCYQEILSSWLETCFIRRVLTDDIHLVRTLPNTYISGKNPVHGVSNLWSRGISSYLSESWCYSSLQSSCTWIAYSLNHCLYLPVQRVLMNSKAYLVENHSYTTGNFFFWY